MVDSFVTVLEKFLNVKAIRFSLAERWRQYPPSEAGDCSITDYLALVGSQAKFDLHKLMVAERVLADVLQLLPYLPRFSAYI